MKTSKVVQNLGFRLLIGVGVGLVLYKVLQGKSQSAHTAAAVAGGIAGSMPSL